MIAAASMDSAFQSDAAAAADSTDDAIDTDISDGDASIAAVLRREGGLVPDSTSTTSGSFAAGAAAASVPAAITSSNRYN
jgi:hypothetical protein